MLLVCVFPIVKKQKCIAGFHWFNGLVVSGSVVVVSLPHEEYGYRT